MEGPGLTGARPGGSPKKMLNPLPTTTVERQYDFIVVGAGPAGCTVATRLAESAKQPKVLLLDAGGRNAEKGLRVDGERWLTFMANPNMNWGYKTTRQDNLKGRQISYDRGKGLGGSSAINFSVYDIGPRDDFEEIARIAGDQSWGWKDAQRRLKSIESYHGDVSEEHQKYLKPLPENHGTHGKIHIGFPQTWERCLPHTLDCLEQSGMEMNPDINSGNPLGWGPCPSSAYKGIRSTSADMLLDGPEILTILTEAPVQRILFNGKTAIGVESDGRAHYASKEVILSAGSLDTPKLLMLSGIGPSEQLQKHQIPLLHELPSVGRGLRDHIHINMVFRRRPSMSDRPAFYTNPEAVAAARVQWEKDQTGPLAEYGVSMAIGFMKSQRIYDSAEFKSLPSEEQRHLMAPTVPSFEILTGTADIRDFIDPANSEASLPLYVFLFNGQSRGEVILQSADPSDPPVMNPNLLSHSFDRRVAIEATRQVLELMESPAFAKDTVGVVDSPKSKSDEDILEFWRDNASSTWHMAGTVKMGQLGDPKACVDHDLRVLGVNSLRVADMSILPIQPNNHTQTTAYYVGATAGDKIATEYGLDAAHVNGA